MKKLLLLAILLPLGACSTIKQAQTDFKNFKKTIEYNSKQPKVYPTFQF